MIIREKYLKQVLRFLLPRKKRTKKKESEDKEEKQKEDPAPSWLQQKLASAAFCLFLDTDQMFLELFKKNLGAGFDSRSGSPKPGAEPDQSSLCRFQ